MTMDIYQRQIRADASSPPVIATEINFRENSVSTMHSPMPKKSSPPLPLSMSFPSPKLAKQKPMKRSFDVAFLMAPDDLTKKREDKLDAKKMYKYSSPSSPPPPLRQLVQLPTDCETSLLATNTFDPHRYQMSALSLTIKREANQSPEIESRRSPTAGFFTRSAFTKVNNSVDGCGLPRTPPIAISPSSVSSTASNRSGMSPDLTYQDSLSPQPFVPSARSPVQILAKHYGGPLPSTNSGPPPYFVGNAKPEDKSRFSTNLLENTAAAVAAATAAGFGVADKRMYGMSAAKSQSYSGYHLDGGVSAYTGFPIGVFPFTPAASSSVPIFPTASLTAAGLLPTSLAALTLPAQNVCAKCNMHFRMTSDLVYHMRSHHKNENGIVDPYKRRRDQDKLKCSVCNESFRERHHLTRHMTAHQDKKDENAAAAAVASTSNEFLDVTLQHRPITGSAK